jgi:hypothetical protein
MAGEIFSASSLQPKFQNDYQNNEVWSQPNDLRSNVYVINNFFCIICHNGESTLINTFFSFITTHFYYDYEFSS